MGGRPARAFVLLGADLHGAYETGSNWIMRNIIESYLWLDHQTHKDDDFSATGWEASTPFWSSSSSPLLPPSRNRQQGSREREGGWLSGSTLNSPTTLNGWIMDLWCIVTEERCPRMFTQPNFASNSITTTENRNELKVKVKGFSHK